MHSLKLPTKDVAWQEIKEASCLDDRDYWRADAAYAAYYKGTKWLGPMAERPAPWAGGELDAVNVALDRKVSSPMEAFVLLTSGARKWTDITSAIKTLREVPGLERLRLPDEVYAAMNEQLAAEVDSAFEAAYAV